MNESILLNSYRSKHLSLSNRVIMAPMTRTRAAHPGDVATDVMAKYYAQRATAGLIISEAVHVSAQAVGYMWAPGIFTEAQVNAWKKVTDAVHARKGKIFIQLFHTGRLSHAYFQHGGEQHVAPSAITAEGCFAFIKNYYGETIKVPFATPRAATIEDIQRIKQEFVSASHNATKAGFDGVEIHGANGYLLEQFLNPFANQRTDVYGGNIENRSRLLLEIMREVASAIGSERTALRLSPFGTLHDMKRYEETEETYRYITEKVNSFDIAYLHLFNQAAFGTGEITDKFLKEIRNKFNNALMLCGGYTFNTATQAINDNLCDVIAFGRPFIANPDLVERFQVGAPLAESDPSLWYGSNAEKGYADYPSITEVEALS